MKSTAALALSLSLAGGTLVAQDDPVRALLSKDLAGVPGKELSMITVEYPPGASSPPHTHLAYHFYETHGRRDGHGLDDWLSAERELTHHDR